MERQLKQVKEFMQTAGQHTPESLELGGIEHRRFRAGLLYEENLEYIVSGDEIELADSLADKLYVLLGTIISHGLEDKIVEIFDEVHRSNMTKFIPAVLINTVDIPEEAQTCTKVNDYFVCKNEQGKVIKPSTYHTPDLSKILCNTLKKS